jgi:hypothetical protein
VDSGESPHRSSPGRGDRCGPRPDPAGEHLPVHQHSPEPRLLRLSCGVAVLLPPGALPRRLDGRGGLPSLGADHRRIPGHHGGGADRDGLRGGARRAPPAPAGCCRNPTRGRRSRAGTRRPSVAGDAHPSGAALRRRGHVDGGHERSPEIRARRGGPGPGEPGHPGSPGPDGGHVRHRWTDRDRFRPGVGAPGRRGDGCRCPARLGPVVGSETRRCHPAAQGRVAGPRRDGPRAACHAGPGICRGGRPPDPDRARAGQPGGRRCGGHPDRADLLLLRPSTSSSWRWGRPPSRSPSFRGWRVWTPWRTVGSSGTPSTGAWP